MSQSLFLFDEAVKLCRANQDQALLARTLVRRATTYNLVANYQVAQTDVEEALLISEAVGLQQVYAEALRLKGMNLYRQGETQDAIEWLTHSLTMYELLGEEQNVAMVHLELGMTEASAGYYAKALNYNAQALLYWESVDNAERLANLLNNQGVLYHLCGDYQKAVITWEQALTQAKQNDNPRMEAYILSSFGDLYVELEAYRQAQLAYQKSRTQAQRHDERFLLFYLLLAEASLSMKQGLLSQAGYLLADASDKVSDSRLEQGFLSLARGQLALHQERYSEAIPLLEMATRHLQRAQQQPKAACAHLYLAVAHHYGGYEHDAFGHLERAFQLAARLESEHTLLIAGGDMADKLPVFKTPAVKRLLAQVEEFSNSLPSLRRHLRQHIRFIPLDPPRLTIRGLGESSAMVNDTEVHWRWAKGRDLLFCLLLYPRGLTKEEIGELLWPGSTAKGLKINFKQAMKFLRQAIGSESVRYQGGRYLFNRSIDYEYDVESFLAHRKLAGKQEATPEQIQAYEGALQHYGGLFLRAVGDDWVLAERTRLHQLYLEAMVRLASLYLKQNDLQMALQRCEEAFLAEPALEEAHRLAMRIHAIHGNRVGVANQFERCKKALAELSLAPSQKTNTLYQRLMK
jgi:DNA-binding SARP family transcriptional activator